MRILHLSDLHGRAHRLARAQVERHAPDWIVLTGDMVEDPQWIPGEARRLRRQHRTWARLRGAFLHEGACTTLVRGNHEREGFQDEALQKALPEALAGQVGILEGIPAEFGPWGFPRELSPEALACEMDAQGEPPIWLSHVPPFGLLDATKSGHRVGHRPLAARLASSQPPALVLCGHVHESFGALRHGPTLVVNAAGGFALLEWDGQRAELLEQGLLVRYSPWSGLFAALRPRPD